MDYDKAMKELKDKSSWDKYIEQSQKHIKEKGDEMNAAFDLIKKYAEDLWNCVGLFFNGFTDNGRSYDKMIDILEEDFQFKSWTSR
jgi:hypothetical protein